jgi:hypothetical protein
MPISRPVHISAAVEGDVDEAVLRCLVQQTGAELTAVYGKAGKVSLLQRINGYNQAAGFSPWIVLVDLDDDADCAPPFRTEWLPNPAPQMCFRIAVREVEAWLLADRERLARFLSVAPVRVPPAPESVQDPKRSLVDVARHSRRREIKEDMVPRPGSDRPVGPAYNSRLREFVAGHCRPEVAEEASDSLRRCRERLHQLVMGRRGSDTAP